MVSSQEKQRIKMLMNYVKDIPDLIKEFKGAVIVVLFWLIVAQLAGYSILSTILSTIRLILYPLSLIFFNTEFSDINVPEIFIILIPLVILTLSAFLIIIATED